MKYNICVIGLGSIGGLRDCNTDYPNSNYILTHCHAVNELRKNGLVDKFYVYDVDYPKIDKASEKWNAIPLYDFNTVIDNIDIFVVAVTTEYQHQVLLDILGLSKKHNIKLVIAEKPFTNNYEQALDIHELYSNANIPIAINYSRKFSPELQVQLDKLKDGEYGDIQCVDLVYTRGLVRDGSHGIDFINYFLGDFISGQILCEDEWGIEDYSKSDLTLPVYLSYTNCKHVFLNPANGDNYSVFELDVYTSMGKLSFIDHFRKIILKSTVSESSYGNFLSLGHKYESLNVTLENTIYKLYLNVIDYLNGKSNKLYSTSGDALKVHEVYKYLWENR